jgi:GNAT superfamily N-acetyltransferase
MTRARSSPSTDPSSPLRLRCGTAAPIFDHDYREAVVLADGRPARLFALRAEHAAELARGFARLSSQSRYLRFFTAKRELGAEQLRELVELDGCDRYAIAVAVHTLAGWEGAAVGRLARVEGAPGSAELAITVIDEFHHLGIGGMLLERLRTAALERGYARMHGEVLAENRPMLGLLRKELPQLTLQTDGTVVVVDAALSRTSAPAPAL